MANFFENFPKIQYDIQGKRRTNYDITTNIFFRIQFIRSILANISAYYEYLIKDDDTPEILAEKIYNDPEAHWIILLANDIVDPQYDWPLNTNDFKKYIINKYGSVENAKTTYHHYEKVIERIETLSDTLTETRFHIDYDIKTNTILQLSSVNGNFTIGNTVYVSSDSTLSNAIITAIVQNWSNTNNSITITNLVKPANTRLEFQTILENNSNTSAVVSSYILPTVPYDYYVGLPETGSFETINMGNGKTVIEKIRREAVTNYDYENQLNENKRPIKIIKPEYYQQIIKEFNDLVKINDRRTYIRRLV